MRRQYTAVAGLVIGALVAQEPRINARLEQRATALPVEEQFVQGVGLRLRLTMRSTELKPFEDPGFTLHFENAGTTTLLLNPLVESNLYIHDAAGAFVKPTSTWINDCVLVAIGRPQLVRLKPGERWSRSVRASHSPNGLCSGYAYRLGARDGLALRGGRYVARFVYQNYPGHPANYDVHEIRDIWEGRQESEPLSFSVAAGAEPELDRIEAFDTRKQPAAFTPSEPLRVRTPSKSCAGWNPDPLFMGEDVPDLSALSQLSSCGEAAAFEQLRLLVGSTKPTVRFPANQALRTLTFTAQQFDEVPARGWADDWDAWYRTHKSESRAQWAGRRLREVRRADHSDVPNMIAAIDYLASLDDTAWRDAILQVADARLFELRIAAARAITTWDVETGIALLVRELRNRQLAACEAAVSALAGLTGQKIEFDFKIPEERDRATRIYSAAR